jgi:hypothetical protein
MALPTYKIIFKDGTTQTLPSTGPKLVEEWFTFADGSGTQLCVRADEVESVMRSDITERTGEAPKAA